MMSALNQLPLVTALGWMLIHALWQVTLIWILYWIVKRIFHGYSSQTRYVFACFTLVAVVASMAVTFVFLMGNLFGRGPIAAWLLPKLPMATNMPHHVMLTFAATPEWLQTTIANLSPMMPFIGVVWSGAVAWKLFNTARAVVTLNQLTHTADLLTPDAVPGWQRLCAQLIPTKRVLLGESTFTTSPFTAGWLKPLVLLPIGLLTSLPPHQIEAILAHELAHIRRRDYLVNFLQSVAELLLFFHPCVRSLGKDIRNLREHCCDDLAIAAIGGSRRAYAESLIAVEEFRPEIELMLGAGGGSLLDRVQRLAQLQRKPEKNGIVRSLATGIFLLLLVAFGADAAIQRVQDDRILQAVGSRGMMDSIYDVLDANRDNPEFLRVLVPVLETFRASKGLDPEDADRLSNAINKGARPTYLYSVSKEIYLDGHLLKSPANAKWKGGTARRSEDLATALFERAKAMPPSSERFKMARAAMILAGQENYLPNSVALEWMIRDADLEGISGMPPIQIHRIRQVLAYHQARFMSASIPLGKWIRADDLAFPQEVTPEIVYRYPFLAWRLIDFAKSLPPADPRREQAVSLVRPMPVYGQTLIESFEKHLSKKSSTTMPATPPHHPAP